MVFKFTNCEPWTSTGVTAATAEKRPQSDASKANYGARREHISVAKPIESRIRENLLLTCFMIVARVTFAQRRYGENLRSDKRRNAGSKE